MSENNLPTDEQITAALSKVIDPELRKDIVELGMVRSVTVHPNGVADITVSLTTPVPNQGPLRERSQRTRWCPARHHSSQYFIRRAL